MNWPRLKLLLRHESGTKRRRAQRFLPRKLDSSVGPPTIGCLGEAEKSHIFDQIEWNALKLGDPSKITDFFGN